MQTLSITDTSFFCVIVYFKNRKVLHTNEFQYMQCTKWYLYKNDVLFSYKQFKVQEQRQ